jgi:hypothetical protein
MKPGFFLFVFIQFFGTANSQNAKLTANDTTLVGKIISTDSAIITINADRFGYRFYYGLYHLKIGVIDVSSGIVKDTMIVARVYNKRSEIKDYLDGFNLRVGEDYIFDLSVFSPCHSDFHRLEGHCKGNNYFVPLSSKLTKGYSKIYRIVNTTPRKLP